MGWVENKKSEVRADQSEEVAEPETYDDNDDDDDDGNKMAETRRQAIRNREITTNE